MEADFHSDLNVKHALLDDIIWVAYIHPLSPLRDDQCNYTIAQVRSAGLTYGTLYTSTDLLFPGNKAGQKRQEETLEKKKGKKL